MKISKQIFNKNIASLERVNPQLAIKVREHRADKINFEFKTGFSKTVTVSGIQLSSRHDPRREANLQASVLASSREIYLYGLGLGYLPEKIIERLSLCKLHIKILNLSLFSLILHLRDQTIWLADERTTITLANADLEIKSPYFVFMPDVLLADDSNQRIKNVIHANICGHYSKRQFQVDDSLLLNRIKENYIHLQADKGIEHLFDEVHPKEAIVVGAGSSLEGNITLLERCLVRVPRPLLVSVATASKILVEAGIIPDYLVVIDKDVSLTHPLVAKFSKMKNTRLVYYPLANPQFIGDWPGDRYAAYSTSPLFDSVRRELPKTALFSGGSVIHTAIDLAKNLGSSSITLCGVDFAYVDNQIHAGYEGGVLYNYEHISSSGQAKRWVRNGYGKSIPTHDSFISYLVELERYIKKFPNIKFWNVSKMGASINGCEYVEDY